MGECGCNEMQPTFRFRGPGKDKYVCEVYPSCTYCETPVGIVLYRFEPKDAKLWDIEFVPDKDISDVGTMIPIIDLGILNKKVEEYLGDDYGLRNSDWASILGDVINETLKKKNL